MLTTKLRPIRKESLRQRAYLELKEALLCGRFMPGEVITVREIADEMQLGVMPVRECVRQLSAEGALEFMPNRSVRVPALTPDEFEEVFDARILIESHAAAKAAEKITKSQLQKVSKYLEQLATLQDGQDAHACLLVNLQFHFEIYRACGSTHLLNIIERLWLRVSSLLIISYSAPRTQRSAYFSELDTHRKLLHALESRDRDAAAQLTKDILSRSRDWHLQYNEALSGTPKAKRKIS